MEQLNKQDALPSTSEIGVDFELEYFYSDRNDNHVREASRRGENPRYFCSSEKDIKRV